MGGALRDADRTFAAVTREVDAPWDPLVAAETSGLSLSGYWEQPENGIAAAALGVVSEQSASDAEGTWALLQALSSELSVVRRGPRPLLGPWFGGLAFDLHHPPSGAWQGFPTSRWILPEVLIARQGGRASITAVSVVTTTGEEALAHLEAKLDRLIERLRSPSPLPEPVKAEASGEDQARWDRFVAGALEAFAAGKLWKVVAARAITVRGEAALPLTTTLDRLRKDAPTCSIFLIRGADGAAFVGATPELLCAVESGRLDTVALGGTRLGDDAAPWPTDKELREHAAIVDGISDALRPLCTRVEHPAAPRELRLARLSHLETRIDATLSPGASLGDVVRALHPTPAVGGTPRGRALEFLREHEGLERGWYAGAVGWVGARRAELRVALRCALIKDDRALVFAGAGLVEGSVAEAEWNETAVKARGVLAALGVVVRG